MFAESAPEPLFIVPLNGELPVEFVLQEPPDGENLPLGPPGSGLSGKPESVSFDNTSATGMGYDHHGTENVGRLLHASAPELAEISSLTLCGWFRTDLAKSASGARLVSSRSQLDVPGFELQLQIGRLALHFNDQKVTSEKLPVEMSEWTFLAVSVDGNSGLVQFYFGSSWDRVQKLGEGFIEPGSHISSNSPVLSIGNMIQFTRPFHGLIDRVRVFASSNGGEGALSEEQLEKIRLEDLDQ